jgi:hypothetical protein
MRQQSTDLFMCIDNFEKTYENTPSTQMLNHLGRKNDKIRGP